MANTITKKLTKQDTDDSTAGAQTAAVTVSFSNGVQCGDASRQGLSPVAGPVTNLAQYNHDTLSVTFVD